MAVIFVIILFAIIGLSVLSVLFYIGWHAVQLLKLLRRPKEIHLGH